MIHLPKQVEYALMALAEMQQGKPGQLFSVRALTKTLGVPYDVAGKALQGMAHAGILRSVQGKYGGYHIARDLAGVSLEELMQAVVGTRAIANCLESGHACPHRGSCSIRRGIVRIEAQLRSFLDSISLQDVLAV